MRLFLALLFMLPLVVRAADIESPGSISCISDKSSLQGRHKQLESRKNSEKAQSWFSEWMMAESFGDKKSRISFAWQPHGEKGATIRIETTDKSHNLIKIRSQTRSSVIVVSSASNPFSTESWTFVINFKVETMIATRVQSNIGGVKGEVITYDCVFESLDPLSVESNEVVS